MRVLFLTPSYFPITGGSEILTHVLTIKLNELGIKADILTFNMEKKWFPKWKSETTETGSVTVFRIGALNPLPNLPNPMSNLLNMNVLPFPGFIRKLKQYDIIHFVGEADLSLAFIAYFIKKPKIFHCVAIFRHGGIYEYYMLKRLFLGKIFCKYFPRLSDKYLVYSSENKRLLSQLGVPFKKILTLQLGVDTKIFQPKAAEKTDNLMLFVGRVDRIKGLHLLIKALPYIRKPIKLVVIGPEWNTKYVSQIKRESRAINEKGFHEIRLLGVIDQKELVSWYQKASILVCPYLYETFSTVTLEALACGTPVVSTGTHIGGDSSDGIMLSSKDPQKLAENINILLENPGLREKLGHDGRKVVEDCFSWDSIVKRLIEIYKSLVKSQSHLKNKQRD